MRERRKMLKYWDDMEEWLFDISHAYMGWPRARNRWLYPDVFSWDEAMDGRLSIPAYIAFYPNMDQLRLHALKSEDRVRFERILNGLLPGPYDTTWQDVYGVVWAIRRPILRSYQLTDRSYKFVRYSTLEWEALNGRGDLPNPSDWLVFPTSDTVHENGHRDSPNGDQGMLWLREQFRDYELERDGE
jgi:hypothetical protein